CFLQEIEGDEPFADALAVQKELAAGDLQSTLNNGFWQCDHQSTAVDADHVVSGSPYQRSLAIEFLLSDPGWVAQQILRFGFIDRVEQLRQYPRYTVCFF